MSNKIQVQWKFSRTFQNKAECREKSRLTFQVWLVEGQGQDFFFKRRSGVNYRHQVGGFMNVKYGAQAKLHLSVSSLK